MRTLPLPCPQQLEATLPQEVLALSNWLPWLPLTRGGGGIGKVPALSRRGRLVPVDCRQAGLLWQEALGLARQYQAGGIGVVLTAHSDLSVLDLDGPLDQERQALLDRVPGYAEISPSGAGVHLWLVGSLPASRRRRGLELLARGFVTVTAQPLPARSRSLGQLSQVVGLVGCESSALIGSSTEPASRMDHEVLTALYGARNGLQARALLEGNWRDYPSPSEADFAAVRLLRFYTSDPEQIERLLRTSGLKRPKFASADYLQRTVHRALALGGPTWEKRSSCTTTK